MDRPSINKDKQERLYREQMGAEALKRQLEQGRITCSQCGGKNGHHHQLCKRRRS